MGAEETEVGSVQASDGSCRSRGVHPPPSARTSTNSTANHRLICSHLLRILSEDALFQFAQEIHLGEYLRLGHGEDLGGGRNRPSVVSDAFEAVIAALYLDGGMEAARNFILPFITEGKTAEEDYKTQLQEVVQQDPSAVLRYEVTGESGPDHAKKFTVCVWRNGEKLAEAPGRSKKAAEQHAAKLALEKLR